MKKGMFCLLPLLVLTQVATSNPHPQANESTVLVSSGTERVRETPVVAPVRVPNVTPTVVIARPVTEQPPRSGRNNRVSVGGRVLIRRN